MFRGAGEGGVGVTDMRRASVSAELRQRGASGGWGGGGGGGRRGGGDVLSREAFEALLPCIFHADAVHDEVSGAASIMPCFLAATFTTCVECKQCFECV